MMQDHLKILYISSEIAPFVKSGNLGNTAGILPKFLKDMGHDIRLFIPKYGTINERRYTVREVIRLKDIKVPLHNKMVVANVKSAFLPNSKVQVYFVENKSYFDRDGLYVDPEKGEVWEDNAERFVFFSQSIFPILKILHWQPDIIHCNDWQTALIPFFLKTVYRDDPFFNETQTVLTIHDLSSQGIFDIEDVGVIGDRDEIINPNSFLEFNGKANFLKAGIVCSDVINTLSKTHAREIRKSEESSFGLQKILKKRSKDIVGIINGVDYSIWDSETDPHITNNFTRKDLSGKYAEKRHLVETCGMKYEEHKPLIGSLLGEGVEHEKELDLLRLSIEDMLKLEVQYIFSANENEQYTKFFNPLVKKYPHKIALLSNADNRLMHQLVAGCDMFLIPSQIAPCDSIHLYCLKYGTIPIVYGSGVMLDTVKNFNPETKQGYGFMFKEYSPASFLYSLKQAINIFSDKIVWKKLIDRAMKLNFSWQTSAERYAKLYYKLVN